MQESSKQRMRGAARAMCRTFGWDKAFGKGKEGGWAADLTGRGGRKDEDLFDAALGFWTGCQKEGVDGKAGRAGSVFRKELLRDLAKWSFKGELWEDITREVRKVNRANPVQIAKMQDVEAAITPRALQGMRECLPSYEKGKHGMELQSRRVAHVIVTLRPAVGSPAWARVRKAHVVIGDQGSNIGQQRCHKPKGKETKATHQVRSQHRAVQIIM